MKISSQKKDKRESNIIKLLEDLKHPITEESILMMKRRIDGFLSNNNSGLGFCRLCKCSDVGCRYDVCKIAKINILKKYNLYENK